jgi:heme-degrading monooxygenase HmoA
MFVSLTRLRIRSVRFMPSFALYALRSRKQASLAPGFLTGALLADRKFTFWTLTGWETQEDMRRYMTSCSHKRAMPHLLHWCDEASVASWMQDEPTLPDWNEADRRMRTQGRHSKVYHPSPHHADLSYAEPVTTASGPIRKA